ncbi:hypothetical protein A3Q56_08030 [Intoshia linei]|uniref:Uncharacterized protein n=1 Tax=Intoshia linei TaxID=1819745 RepID=A0A177ASP7_9BILA|nr:hypothetical protein A3Q56_08030 [Intoshia linei]
MSVKAFDYDHSIEKLAQYLKIETVQPNPKYGMF